ncbi:DMT(drug/metabolite transporter) superfamily permease [Desulfosporosinus orientis DSM 765]|uniref:DMT(Drug/metabolite transporter) superfamily permease n=1 Tax=Desulfosporosinus orientis (strain ATCC 19365 / DSM 765 / NCIMB 8382 / VKM B-1628 / Singapore I) TaxID=768706 RepID=G7WG05_DESOD|nr:EamA family transporter [Desulfosporosinus orientis]AET69520.1 DMT(drug/metabolite transporter) superfamily permease [Desulfosporosinus orientis DSM 765]
MGKSEEYKVILAYIGVCIIWGSTYLAIRIGVSDFPPELFAGLRFLIAGALVLSFAYFRGYKLPDNFRDIRNQAIVGLFLLMGGNGIVVWTEQWVYSGATSLIMAIVPLFNAVLELFFVKEQRIGWKGWLGLFLGFGGVALLALTGADANIINLSGGVLLMLAALSWSTGSVYSKTFKASGSIVANIGIQMFAGGVGLTILGLLIGEAGSIHLSIKGIGAMAYLIFVGSILGYSSYIYVLEKWPASKAGTYAYVNPVVGILLGAVFLKEPVSSFVILSAIIILEGVFLVQVSKTGKTPPRTVKRTLASHK